MTSPYLDRPRRQLWKALADTGHADYFRWTFGAGSKAIVLSVGKAHSDRDRLRHAASKDTCEVMLWRKGKPDRDLMPEDITSLLEPWQRFFDGDTGGGAIARHMPDSILTALVFALDHYFDQECFAHSLLGTARYSESKVKR